MFNWLKGLFSAFTARKKEDEKWANLYTNPPADHKNKLPLDPQNDPWGRT